LVRTGLTCTLPCAHRYDRLHVTHPTLPLHVCFLLPIFLQEYRSCMNWFYKRPYLLPPESGARAEHAERRAWCSRLAVFLPSLFISSWGHISSDAPARDPFYCGFLYDPLKNLTKAAWRSTAKLRA
jgi:hypothetical protein